MSLYSLQLLDHFENPRNAGEIAGADVRVRMENPACGDVLELSANIRNGQIEAIRFRAKGCVPAMACGSLLTELVAGKTANEAAGITKAMLVGEIGGLPEASGHAAQLAVDALQVMLRKAGAHD
jgi:nitrogen fixation NifU-like protein